MQRPLLFALILALALLLGGAWYWLSSRGAPVAPAAPPNATSDDERPAAATGAVATPPAGAVAVDRTDKSAGPEVAAAGRTLLRVHTKWPDGAAAPDVRVRMFGWSAPTRYLRFDPVTSGDDGVATFHDVTPGRWRIETHRGERMFAVVEPGVQDVDFVLEAGVTVAGRVVDERGHPVADASVWLQTQDPLHTGGSVVATADDGGRFRLEHVPPFVSLGAFARGYRRSKLVDLDLVDTAADPAQVTLTVPDGGGVVTGFVTDDNDRALAGARVALGDESEYPDSHGDRVIERWSVPNTTTDEHGRFVLAGLTPGEAVLTARAAGHGFARPTVTVLADGPTDVHVRMQPAGAVFGVVRDGAGAPIAEARVRCYDREPGTMFLASGQIDFDAAFGHVMAVSDAAGRFRVDDVTAGKAWLFAQPNGSPGAGAVLVAQAQLDVAPGAAVEWNPVLSKGRTIRGVLRYRDGHAMGNCFVMLNDERSDTEHVINNERDGTFEFLNLADTSYSLRVQYPFDSPTDAAPLERAGLRPDAAPLELTAPFDKPVKLAKGTVIGRVDDVGLRITNPKTVRVGAANARWSRSNGELVDGAFRLEEIPPGRLRILLRQDDTVIATSDWFELLPAAQLDIGVIRTVPGGALRIQATRAPGCERVTPELYFRRVGAPRSTRVELGTDDSLDVPNLTPGPYEFFGDAKGMLSVEGTTTVTAGETTPVALTIAAGTKVRFSVEIPKHAAPASYSWSLRDASGAVVHSHDGEVSLRTMTTFPIVRTLPRGSYSMRFELGDTHRGETEFVVEGGDELPVRFALTPR